MELVDREVQDASRYVGLLVHQDLVTVDLSLRVNSSMRGMLGETVQGSL